MIKGFLIMRDIVTWPKAMAEAMVRLGIEPILVDNDSSYPPLLEWYRTCPYKVIKVGYNGGHRVVFNSGIIQREVKNDYFVISDPDLDISLLPDDTLDKLKDGLSRFPRISKCGLALRLDDIPDEYPLKNQVHIWEDRFWEKSLGDDFYEAPVDTTFALYHSSRTASYGISAVRVGGDYTARHLPFYLTPSTLNDELVYYFDHCDRNVSSQGKYLDSMIRKYKETR